MPFLRNCAARHNSPAETPRHRPEDGADFQVSPRRPNPNKNIAAHPVGARHAGDQTTAPDQNPIHRDGSMPTTKPMPHPVGARHTGDQTTAPDQNPFAETARLPQQNQRPPCRSPALWANTPPPRPEPIRREVSAPTRHRAQPGRRRYVSRRKASLSRWPISGTHPVLLIACRWTNFTPCNSNGTTTRAKRVSRNAVSISLMPPWPSSTRTESSPRISGTIRGRPLPVNRDDPPAFVHSGLHAPPRHHTNYFGA